MMDALKPRTSLADQGSSSTDPLDHDDFGSNRSKIINVIDSNRIEHDVVRKPVPTFRHHALGPHRLRSLSRHALTGTVLLFGAGVALPSVAENAATQRIAPLQVMADVTLIDARCRELVVDFGALFRYGEANGITAVAVLPLGKLRKSFEAAYARRANSTSPEDLCTGVVEQDDEAAPGVIRRP